MILFLVRRSSFSRHLSGWIWTNLLWKHLTAGNWAELAMLAKKVKAVVQQRQQRLIECQRSHLPFPGRERVEVMKRQRSKWIPSAMSLLAMPCTLCNTQMPSLPSFASSYAEWRDVTRLFDAFIHFVFTLNLSILKIHTP